MGAVTALVSNFFFLQGPWTPWQMAAWGGVGVAGAALAWALRGRELGRVPLALACGLAGLGFGPVMDLHLWTLGAEQTLASYLAVAGTSLPFNVAHVVGNLGFCLLIGPPLVRALRRYRLRAEVRWAAVGDIRGVASTRRPGRRAGGAVLAAILVLAPLVSAPAAEAGGGKAARYLVGAQNADGGFGGDPGSSSNQLPPGGRRSAWPRPAGTPRRDLGWPFGGRLHPARRGSDTGALSRTILVLTASGVSPRSFGGRDLVAELRADRRGDGSFDGLVNQTAFGMMALGAADARSRKSVRWLEKQQNQNGGFGFDAGDGSPDDTGGVLQALAPPGGGEAEPSGERCTNGGRQKATAGFGATGGRSNAQSTAYAVQGLIAAGRRAGGPQGLGYLRSLQTGYGSIRYSRASGRTPVWVTARHFWRSTQGLPAAHRPRAKGGGGSAGGAAERPGRRRRVWS